MTQPKGRVSHTQEALQEDHPEDPEVRRRGRQEKTPPLVPGGQSPRDGVDRQRTRSGLPEEPKMAGPEHRIALHRQRPNGGGRLGAREEGLLGADLVAGSGIPHRDNQRRHHLGPYEQGWGLTTSDALTTSSEP